MEQAAASQGDESPDVRRPLVALCGIGLAAAFVFVSFPGIDLFVSGLFHVGPQTFVLHADPDVRAVVNVLRKVGLNLVLVLVIGLAGLFVAGFFAPRSRLGGWRRRAAYLLLCFALAPGLLANVVFKDNWGRARPAQIVEFGGDKTFTPAIVRSDQCARNCSFVAGEPAAAFTFVAFGLIAARRWRRLVINGGITYGIVMSAVRIMEGGHFLSDTVFAAVLSLMTCLALFRFLFQRQWGYAPVARTAAAIGRRLGAGRLTVGR